LSPSRYRVQFTIGQETYDKLRWVQAILRREIRNGDPAEIFDRALDLLREEIEQTRLGKTTKAPDRAYENRIRPGTHQIRRQRTAAGLGPITEKNDRATSQTGSSERSGVATTANAHSYQATGDGAANAPSSSSTTFIRTRWTARHDR